MPIQQDLMDEGDWSVGLLADTPKSVLDAIDVRTYAYATLAVTPVWHRVGTITDAELLGIARYTGVYLGMSDGRLNLNGSGMIWWLGQETDNGEMYAGIDTTSAGLDFEDQLDARIFTSNANGLTKGSVNATATTRTIKIPGNLTRRALLDTICAAYADPNYEWRCNPNFSVDADTQATLYPTTSAPTAILTAEGGREVAITGLAADLEVDSIDVEDYRTDIEARWSEATPGTNNGVASNTPPTGWVAPDGVDPVLRTVINYNHKSKFREKPNKPDRFNAANYAVDAVNAVAQATNVAEAHANQTNSYATEVSADVDEYDPWRFIEVGDSVWCYDLDLDLVNTANEVYYRGAAVHPVKLRVQSMTTPILEGYGVYLRYWNGSSFSLYDLTPYVAFEEDRTTFELGTRRRFHKRLARPKRINHHRLHHQYRDNYLIRKYVEAQG